MPGYSPNAYGGVLAGRAYGGVVENTRPLGVGIPANAYVLAGGPEWVDEPPRCAYAMKSTGFPCEATPVKDTDHCLGHARASAKAEKLREAE